MNCRRVERLLSQEQDTPLNAQESRAVAAHLQSCASCRRLRSEFLALGDELRGLPLPSSDSGLARRAIVKWEAEQPAAHPALCPWYLARPARFALTAAVLLLALGGTALWPRHTTTLQPPSQKSPPKPSVIATRAEKPSDIPGNKHSGVQVFRSSGVQKAGPSYVGKGDSHGFSIQNPKSKIQNREGADLAYINADPALVSRWTTLPTDESERLLASLQRELKRGDDFVQVPFPPIAGRDQTALKAAVEAYKREAEIVDTRLLRKARLAVKGMDFATLCKRLRDETGIELRAHRGVADDKVTIFCKERSLRDLMRQISRLFGFTWTRDGEPGAYRYELVQPFRSQLLEEELRNRDRNEALLALDREMERYRKYLGLSPEQAKAQALNAAPEEKAVLEHLAGLGWGAAHLYFGLSPEELNTLRSGQTLAFAAKETPGKLSLPEDMTHGVLESFQDFRLIMEPMGFSFGPASSLPNGKPFSDISGLSPGVSMHLDRSELGQFSLQANADFTVLAMGASGGSSGGGPLAVGVSPSVRNPQNAVANAKLARDPQFRAQVTIETKASCRLEPDPRYRDSSGPRASTADALEAAHRATGMDILADYYTRLYTPEEVSVRETSLFDALNRLADKMRMRWRRENGWLACRSVGFFNERLKEVPNRLLMRWAASRRQSGTLPLEELVEIAQLADVQLDAQKMAEGAEAQYGLKEWELARSGTLREHWHLLASLTPTLRRAAQGEMGAAFSQMPLAQQQRFLALTYGPEVNTANLTLTDLADATLRIQYPMPEIPVAVGGSPANQGIQFLYRYGGANTGHWTAEISPNSYRKTRDFGGQ